MRQPHRDQVIGGYRVLELLETTSERPVAAAVAVDGSGRAVLKMAALESPALVERLAVEARLLESIAGAGVTAWSGHGVDAGPGFAWIAFPVWGPPLTAIVETASKGRLDPTLALTIAQAAAEALGRLHAAGWYHGDVKPANLLVSTGGEVVLTDVEHAGRLDAIDRSTGRATFPGTLPFVAPELWAGGAAARTAASDVWSLGVTLYRIATGEYPFGFADRDEIARRAAAGLPALPAGTPPALEEVLGALLAADPDRRPRDGAAAAARLAAALLALGSEVRIAREELGEVVRRNPLYAVLAGPPTLIEAPALTESPAMVPRQPAAPATAAPIEIITTLCAPDAAGGDLATDRGLEPAPSGFVRRAAARWFTRMNPSRNFPLSVVLSGREIRVRAAAGMKVAIGEREIRVDPADPHLEVEPIFPGCLVAPPVARIDVSPETTVARFWITPLSEGDLADAVVRIRYRGLVVETLATPTTVVARTWARVCLGLSVLSPLVVEVLDGFGWTLADQIRDGFPVLEPLGAAAGPLLIAVCFGLVGAVLYGLTRPVPSADEPDLLQRSLS